MAELRRQLDSALQHNSRLEAELHHLRTEGAALSAELATVRRVHDEARASLHEAQAVIAERAARSAEQDEEIRNLHRQSEALGSERQSMQSERDQLARDLAATRQRAEADRAACAEAEQALNALRMEAAILTEPAAHAEELRAMVRGLQQRSS